MNFWKTIQILNDRRRTSVPYFSSKNRTLLVYMTFRLVQVKVDYFRKCPLTTIIAFQGFQSFSGISLVWDAAVPKVDIEIRGGFHRPVFLFRGCIFKSSFEMRFLFEIVVSLKLKFCHVFIFGDFRSFGMGVGLVLGAVRVNFVFTLPVKRWVHIWYILLYSCMILN